MNLRRVKFFTKLLGKHGKPSSSSRNFSSFSRNFSAYHENFSKHKLIYRKDHVYVFGFSNIFSRNIAMRIASASRRKRYMIKILESTRTKEKKNTINIIESTTTKEKRKRRNVQCVQRWTHNKCIRIDSVLSTHQ